MKTRHSSVKRIYEAPLLGARYCGDSSTRVVHDLDNASPECRIDQILAAGRAIPFHSTMVAHLQGYRNCPQCVGR
ncbi:MAG: hypothetical protein JW828_11790 [Sedimentisphaerales bacterium]|nr:hypothetical protein [Sedimentisphaerales bacterium]